MTTLNCRPDSARLLTLIFLLAAVLGGSATDSSKMHANIISLQDYEQMHPGSFSESVPLELEKVMSIVFTDIDYSNGTDAMYTPSQPGGLWEEQQRLTWQHLRRSNASSPTGSRDLEGERGLYVDSPPSSFYPFLFCNSDVHQTGLKRRSLILSMLGHGMNEVDRAMGAVFSNDNISCFLALATTSEVENVVASDAAIQTDAFPLTPLMKIQNWSYTISAIRNQIGFADPIEIVVKIMAPSKIVDELLARDILQYTIDQIVTKSSTQETPSNNDPVSLRGHRLRDASDRTSCEGLELDIDMIFAESSSVSFNFFPDPALSQKQNADCALSFMAVLSSHPSVSSVSTDERPETLNDMAQQIVQAGELSNLGQHLPSHQVCPYFDAGLTASNQIVGLSDTGIREESCYFSDENGPVERSAYYPGQNLDDLPRDLGKRKIVQYLMHPSADLGDGYNGHGTHVAGTLAGRRSTDGDSIENERGFGDGIAIDAKISFMDIAKTDGSLRIWKNEHLFLPAVATGAYVHSMSWGYASSGYNTLTHNIDRWLFQNDDQLIIVAAGNRGTFGDSTLAMPSTAKNIISVGASHSVGPDISVFEEGLEYVAKYSSRGPAGLRTKPDVVAPGHRLLSADGRSASTGTCDRDGLGREDYLFHDDPSNGLRYGSGTSMSAPVVAGMAVQIRQYFLDGFYPLGEKSTGTSIRPSGSLIKAVIMNGSQFLRGIAESPSVDLQPYDSVQNMGRVSLYHSLPLQGVNDLQLTVHDRIVIEDGDTHDYIVDIQRPSDGCSFRATMVYADEPGETLINDIDLTVMWRGNFYFPNGRSGPDRNNNAERIILENVAEGDRVMVNVNAHNLQSSTMKYALVLTYCGTALQVEPEKSTPEPTKKPSPHPTPAPSIKPTTIQQFRKRERRRKRRQNKKKNRMN